MKDEESSNTGAAVRKSEAIVAQEESTSRQSSLLRITGDVVSENLAAPLHFHACNIKVATAQPEQRETRKSMSRRSGQSGNLVKQSGWWRVRFRFDQPGIQAREQMSLKAAPVSMRLSRPELERRAKEIVQEARGKFRRALQPSGARRGYFP